MVYLVLFYFRERRHTRGHLEAIERSELACVQVGQVTDLRGRRLVEAAVLADLEIRLFLSSQVVGLCCRHEIYQSWQICPKQLVNRNRQFRTGEKTVLQYFLVLRTPFVIVVSIPSRFLVINIERNGMVHAATYLKVIFVYYLAEVGSGFGKYSLANLWPCDFSLA